MVALAGPIQETDPDPGTMNCIQVVNDLDGVRKAFFDKKKDADAFATAYGLARKLKCVVEKVK